MAVVMVAESDCVFPRDQTLLDNLVSKVQDSNKQFDLEGIIVASEYHDGPPMNIHNLMHDLCKKGKFQSLKYACYTDDITSPRAKYQSHLWEGIPDISSAVHMLQANLDVFNTLAERENKYISDYSIEDYPKKDYDSDEDFSE
ncbi:hypothetical protein Q3G72_016495 [Acer saccharum]|nr:hypothetical protein Q3G72_016495 [Acer saccharum]